MLGSPDPTQRAQRSKKFDLDRNFQSRSKFLILLENVNLNVSISPQKKGRGGWLARKFHSRSKFSISIVISNFFDLWALWEISARQFLPFNRRTGESSRGKTTRGNRAEKGNLPLRGSREDL